MNNERLKNILKVLLDIEDIDIIKCTIESLIEDIEVEINNKKDSIIPDI
jgi:hypothetical protein